MTRRAEHIDKTRQRITEAAVRLHTTIGPARSSIASIAEEAGVTRLTFYRHFSNQEALFEACSGHWLASNPPPDATGWAAIADLEPRAAFALRELYRWFGAHGEELYPLYRDVDATPSAALAARTRNNERIAEALIAGFDGDPAHRPRLRAAARHVTGFWTWRSLVVDAGLSTDEAVDLGTRFLLAAR
jgi:AcrR family transcriptional regulator